MVSGLRLRLRRRVDEHGVVGWKIRGSRNVEGSRFTWLELAKVPRSRTLTFGTSVGNV